MSRKANDEVPDAGLPVEEVERVHRALAEFLTQRGLLPGDSDSAFIDLRGKSDKELTLLRIHLSVLTALDAVHGERQLPELVSALGESIARAGKAEALQRERARDIEASGSAGPVRSLIARSRARWIGEAKKLLSAALPLGAHSVTTATEWRDLVSSLCFELFEIGLKNREIASIIYGRDDDSDVEAVKKRRARERDHRQRAE